VVTTADTASSTAPVIERPTTFTINVKHGEKTYSKTYDDIEKVFGECMYEGDEYPSFCSEYVEMEVFDAGLVPDDWDMFHVELDGKQLSDGNFCSAISGLLDKGIKEVNLTIAKGMSEEVEKVEFNYKRYKRVFSGKEVTIIGTKFKGNLTIPKARKIIKAQGGKWVSPKDYEMVTGIVIKLEDADAEKVNDAEAIDEINVKDEDWFVKECVF